MRLSFKREHKSPKLAADIVVFNEKKQVLLVQRKYPPEGWALPGGHVDIGESVEHAAIRELKEETNLDASEITLLGVWSKPNRDPRYHVVSIAYLAKSWTGIPKAADDAKLLEFYDVEPLENGILISRNDDGSEFIPCMAFPDHKEIIRKAWETI